MIEGIVGIDVDGTVKPGDAAAETLRDLVQKCDLADGNRIDGMRVFERIGQYVIADPGRSPGDPVGLMLPFLAALRATTESLSESSRKNAKAFPGVGNILNEASEKFVVRIISTGCDFHVKAFCDHIGFDMKNAVCTKVPRFGSDLVPDCERKHLLHLMRSLTDIKKIEADNSDFRFVRREMKKIFTKFTVGKFFGNVVTVNRLQKKLVFREICLHNGIECKRRSFFGDSITDWGVMAYVRQNGGMSVSMNGTKDTLRYANVAYIGEDPAGAIKRLLDLFACGGWDCVKSACSPDLSICQGFLTVVTPKNIDKLGLASSLMRNQLHIGNLP